MTGLRGVFPVVCTTFRDDGSVDAESQRRLVRHLVDGGAHGLGLFGNASEGYTLAGDERRQLLDVILREVDGAVPVVVSSGHTGTDVAVSLSRDAAAAGADALMVLPPYFVKPDADGLLHYYRAIADAVPIPVMVQDAPLLTGVAMGAALLARMARDITGVTCAKVEAPPTAPKSPRQSPSLVTRSPCSAASTANSSSRSSSAAPSAPCPAATCCRSSSGSGRASSRAGSTRRSRSSPTACRCCASSCSRRSACRP